MTQCVRCNRFVPKGRKRFCSDQCSTAYHTARCRRRMRRRAIVLKGGRCQEPRCGREVDLDDPSTWGDFDFHHTDPDEKDYPISRLPTASWKAIETELEKCELLCRRCHMVKYHGWSLWSSEDDRMSAAFEDRYGGEDDGDVRRGSSEGDERGRRAGLEPDEEQDDQNQAAKRAAGREVGEAGAEKEEGREADPLPEGQGSQGRCGTKGPAQESRELEVVPF